MRNIIYIPGVGDLIPEGSLTYDINMPNPSGPHTEQIVVDAIVDNAFTTTGTILYDANDNTGQVVVTKPLVGYNRIHKYAGW